MPTLLKIRYQIQEPRAEKTAWGFALTLYKPDWTTETLVPITAAELTALTLTLYDEATIGAVGAGIINAVNDENILNAGHGTLHATSGRLNVGFHDADNPIVTASTDLEVHVALIEATFNAGLDSIRQEIVFSIKNLSKVA